MPKFRIVLAAIVLIVAGQGCSQAEKKEPAYLSAQQTAEEYNNETKKWNLAPGHTWPNRPYAETKEDGRQVVYEKGIGRNDASLDWWCSWAQAMIDAQTDDERRAAIAEVLRIPETPWYSRGLAAEDRPVLYRDVIQPLKNGDDSGVKVFVQQNCAP